MQATTIAALGRNRERIGPPCHWGGGQASASPFGRVGSGRSADMERATLSWEAREVKSVRWEVAVRATHGLSAHFCFRVKAARAVGSSRSRRAGLHQTNNATARRRATPAFAFARGAGALRPVLAATGCRAKRASATP